MTEKIIIWIIVIICVEAVTEIIVDSDLFFRVRNIITKINSFVGELFSCGYCLSVWISFAICWALPGSIVRQIFPDSAVALVVDSFIKAMVLHRLSNILHEGIKRWLDRYPWVISISKTVDNDDILIEGSDESD